MEFKDIKVESGQGALSSETVEKYLATLTEFSEKTLGNKRSMLKRFIPLMDSEGTTTGAIEAFKRQLEKKGTDKDYTQKHISTAQAFCQWLEQEEATQSEAGGVSISETVTDDTQNSEPQCEPKQGNADTEGADTMDNEKTKRGPGRPKRTDGLENRSQKFSLYLPPSLYTALDELSRFQGRSITDILVMLAEGYVKEHTAELDIFRRARQEAAKLQGQD